MGIVALDMAEFWNEVAEALARDNELQSPLFAFDGKFNVNADVGETGFRARLQVCACACVSVSVCGEIDAR